MLPWNISHCLFLGLDTQQLPQQTQLGTARWWFTVSNASALAHALAWVGLERTQSDNQCTLINHSL